MGSKTKSGGGRKIGRNKAHQGALYKSGDRWNVNRKRAMRQHLRANPNDAVVRAEYDKRYGKVESLGLTKRGQRKAKRAARLAQAA